MFNVIRPSVYPLTVIRLPLGPVYKTSKLPSILDSVSGLRPMKCSARTFPIADFKPDRFSMSAITLLDTVKSRSTVCATIVSTGIGLIESFRIRFIIIVIVIYALSCVEGSYRTQVYDKHRIVLNTIQVAGNSNVEVMYSLFLLIIYLHNIACVPMHRKPKIKGTIIKRNVKSA